MNISDYQNYINFEREFDSVCRVFWEFYCEKRKIENAHYLGKLLRNECVAVLYYIFNIAKCQSTPTYMLTYKDEPHPYVLYLSYEEFDKDFDDLKFELREKIITMRLREFFDDLDEGFISMGRESINKGPSNKFKNPGEICNFNYHFGFAGHTYDVWGFNNKRWIHVNFMTDGKNDLALENDKVNRRKVFGTVIECAKWEAEDANIKEIMFKAKIKDDSDNKKVDKKKTVKDLYSNTVFQKAIEKETGFALDSEGENGSYYEWWYKKK